MEMKEKERKEYVRRTKKNSSKQSSAVEILSNNKSEQFFFIYSGPFLKWAKDAHSQIDQRTRKLMTIHNA